MIRDSRFPEFGDSKTGKTQQQCGIAGGVTTVTARFSICCHASGRLNTGLNASRDSVTAAGEFFMRARLRTCINIHSTVTLSQRGWRPHKQRAQGVTVDSKRSVTVVTDSSSAERAAA